MWKCVMKLEFLKILVIYMGILPARMSVNHRGSSWYSGKQEGSFGFPRIRATDGCEPPSRSWELNLGSLEEEPGLLTSSSQCISPALKLVSWKAGNIIHIGCSGVCLTPKRSTWKAGRKTAPSSKDSQAYIAKHFRIKSNQINNPLLTIVIWWHYEQM